MSVEVESVDRLASSLQHPPGISPPRSTARSAVERLSSAAAQPRSGFGVGWSALLGGLCQLGACIFRDTNAPTNYHNRNDRPNDKIRNSRAEVGDKGTCNDDP